MGCRSDLSGARRPMEARVVIYPNPDLQAYLEWCSELEGDGAPELSFEEWQAGQLRMIQALNVAKAHKKAGAIGLATVQPFLVLSPLLAVLVMIIVLWLA
jgi:hypothetical protein